MAGLYNIKTQHFTSQSSSRSVIAILGLRSEGPGPAAAAWCGGVTKIRRQSTRTRSGDLRPD